MFASTLLSHSPQHQFLILLGIFPVTPSEHLLVLCVAPPWEPYCLCRRWWGWGWVTAGEEHRLCLRIILGVPVEDSFLITEVRVQLSGEKRRNV